MGALLARASRGGHSEHMEDQQGSETTQSQWRQVFFAVEAPGFTGFEPRRHRRSLVTVIGAMLAAIVVIVVLSLSTSDGTAPSPPTDPPLTFVTLPPPEPAPGA
jgi:hypothetical protein